MTSVLSYLGTVCQIWSKTLFYWKPQPPTDNLVVTYISQIGKILML